MQAKLFVAFDFDPAKHKKADIEKYFEDDIGNLLLEVVNSRYTTLDKDQLPKGIDYGIEYDKIEQTEKD